jgi:Lrp/AsnC family transcriptional regulator for asnA, asnC and gidA
MAKKDRDSKFSSPIQLPDTSDIDMLSRRIIRLLQEDGRRSFTSIARDLGVSETAVRNRVANLEKNQHLRFIAVIDPVQAGFGSWAMLGIRVTPGTSPESLGLQFSSLKGAIWVGIVGGRYDLMVEVWAANSKALYEFLEEHCYSDTGIASVEVMVGMRIQKWGAPGL